MYNRGEIALIEKKSYSSRDIISDIVAYLRLDESVIKMKIQRQWTIHDNAQWHESYKIGNNLKKSILRRVLIFHTLSMIWQGVVCKEKLVELIIWWTNYKKVFKNVVDTTRNALYVSQVVPLEINERKFVAVQRIVLSAKVRDVRRKVAVNLIRL